MATKNKDAVEFVKRWIDKGDEKQYSQLFWTDLLSNVLHSTVNNFLISGEIMFLLILKYHTQLLMRFFH